MTLAPVLGEEKCSCSEANKTLDCEKAGKYDRHTSIGRFVFTWLSKLASVDWQPSIVHIHFPRRIISTDGDHHVHLDFPLFFGFPGLILFLWQRLEFWILDLQTALKKC